MLGGVDLTLANSQLFFADIAPNASNPVFTVNTPGRYRISYHVNTTASLLMGTRLRINGPNTTASTITPIIASSNFSNEIEIHLVANSTISLQMFPPALAGVATLIGNWRQAAFWYTLATTCRRDDSRGGFTSPDCYGYLPCIQLCVCYSRIGQLEKANRFNDLAGEFKPDSEVVLQNREYFATLNKDQ